jgi:cysteine-rich repeat protein
MRHTNRLLALPLGGLPLLFAAACLIGPGSAGRALAIGPYDSGLLLYSTEANRLRRYDIDTIGGTLVEDILIQRAADDPVNGRDSNGVICPIPDGSGRFVLGEDTGQSAIPPGWGVFSSAGVQEGKLTATYQTGGAEPFGCVFDDEARLFTTDVGSQAIGSSTGQLILWFPPYDVFPGAPTPYPNNSTSDNFCKIAVDIGTAGQPVIDGDGRIYVTSSGGLSVLRFSPPFPTGPDASGGCGAVDAKGSPLADAVNREVFLAPQGLSTYSGIALAPNGNLYIATNLTGTISEYDLDGNLVRKILDPGPFTGLPITTGNPQSLAVDPQGTIYYADLNLQGTLPNVGTGPNGKVWRITFDENNTPNAPEIVREGLGFPDGVAVVEGNLEPLTEWRTYAGDYSRRFYNGDEQVITNENVHLLEQAWRFPTDAIITGSPSVAAVDIPGEGPTQVVYFQSWDFSIHAVRMIDGRALWRFQADEQPGASFPSSASVDISEVNGRDTVYVGTGEIMYALDAVTGEELWRFTAGTGCKDDLGNPPGLCGFLGERNQIETTVALVDGQVFFAMDINDYETGKGGFYSVDAVTGTLNWYFDLETGATCTPLPGDAIRQFDGYHSEAQLDLPAGFLASRPGCGFDRAVTGCGNVWSSPAIDATRGLIYFASSNCDTDNNPATPRPGPTMPAYDEAIVALDFNGYPAWRWRPREVDNDDLAFGAAPNLFTIEQGGESREVLGVGNKDGTYYVLDRDGENEINGVAWDDADPSTLPYWRTNVVPGGDIGGIIATAAADEDRRRIYFSTAPGDNSDNAVFNPQRPVMHALNMDTGEVAWNNAADTSAFASFSPTSAIPGVVFTGQVPFAFLRGFNTEEDDGSQILSYNLDNAALASAPVVIDGLLLVGSGSGTRTQTGSGPSDITAGTPSPLTALCVPGTPLCNICQNGTVDPAEQCDDGNDVDGDGCSAQCETEARQVFSGAAYGGGTVSFIVNGVYLQISTQSGDSAFDIASGAAAAINAHPLLSDRDTTALADGRSFVTNGVLTAVRSTDGGIVPGSAPIACPLEAPVYVEAGVVSDSPIFDVELRLPNGPQVAYVSLRGVTAGEALRELDAHNPDDNSAHFGFCSPTAGLLELYLDGTFRGQAKLLGPQPDAKVLSYSTNQSVLNYFGRPILYWGYPLLPREGVTFAYQGFFQVLDPLAPAYAVQVPGTVELVGGAITQADQNRRCRPIAGPDGPLYPAPADWVEFREALTHTELVSLAGNAGLDPEQTYSFCAYKSKKQQPPE